jgi:hypothetical protein
LIQTPVHSALSPGTKFYGQLALWHTQWLWFWRERTLFHVPPRLTQSAVVNSSFPPPVNV